MELSELTAYAAQKYHMQEQHKWADFPGFSVLCHPQTGKWVALLMRQWDTDTGTEIQRCDLKCGGSIGFLRRPYITSPIRMHGKNWIGVCFDDRTEPQIVFRLLDQAVASETPHGFTVVLDSLRSSHKGSYEDTALPFADRAGTSKMQPSRERRYEDTALLSADSVRSSKMQQSGERYYQDTALPFAGSSRFSETKLPGTGRETQPPERLREMRRLYEYGRESSEARARNFYRQAVFMEDYEDDCPWSGGDFVRYFPTYHDLTLKQLRGYFTWRTGVRKGTFKPIAASAAYIYIYELLNGVGADSPENVLKKLRDFEVGYLDSGIGDQRIRGNLHRWMLEYAVINDLSPDLVRESADTEIMARDAAIAVLRRPENYSDEEVFSALCELGGKKIGESPVMKDDPARGRHLFSEAWRFAARPEQENDQFALCFGERKTRRWYPLSNAVYYEQKQAEDKEYILNESRSFQCKDGIWTMSAYESLSYDKKRLPGFLHETDARLRRYLKTGRYLKEKPENAWAIPYIDAAIEEDKKAVLEASRPKITIDLSGLDQIRRDALVTQESLLTEEEIGEAAFSLQEFGAAREVITPAAGKENDKLAASSAEKAGKSIWESSGHTAENGYELTDMSASTSAENGYELTDMTAPTTVENNYQQTDKTLFSAPEDDMIDIPLDNIQIQILRALLDGRDPSEFIRENHRMPSVEADAINEAFYDEIGDTVLFCEGDQLILVEDYIEDVMRAVPRTL